MVVNKNYPLLVADSFIEVNDANITFTEFGGGKGFILSYSNMDMINRSSLVFTKNFINEHGLQLFDSRWTMEHDCHLTVTMNKRFSINFSYSHVSLNGTVRIENSSGRVLDMTESKLEFHGSVEVANTGGIAALQSTLTFTDRATFSDNYAINGGAVSLDASSMYIPSGASVNFTRNYARDLGGAIYITRPKENYVCDTQACSIKLLLDNSGWIEFCPSFKITFSENKAGIAGNGIYGDRTSACVPSDVCYLYCDPLSLNASVFYHYNGVNDSSDLSPFTSDPTRVCLCENGIPNCYKVMTNITFHPGEHFNLSLAIVGYGLGTVPGTVIARGIRDTSKESLFGSELQCAQEIRKAACQDVGYSIVSERDRENRLP